MRRGLSLLVVATILWGGNYLSGRFLAGALPATLLNTIRWAISSLLLLALVRANGSPLPLLARWKELALLGFTGIFAFSTLTYAGLRSISAARAGLISAGIPIAILLFTPLLLKEKVRPRSWIGAGLAIAGVVILFLSKQGPSTGSSIGEAEIVLASIAWGLYTVLGKRFGKELDTLTMMAGASLYGTLFSALSCIGTVRPQEIHMTWMAWASVGYVSTFASVGAYTAWNAGVRRVGTARAAPFINLLPVWTVLLGIIFLHEGLALREIVGGAITIGGAVLATL